MITEVNVSNVKFDAGEFFYVCRLNGIKYEYLSNDGKWYFNMNSKSLPVHAQILDLPEILGGTYFETEQQAIKLKNKLMFICICGQETPTNSNRELAV